VHVLELFCTVQTIYLHLYNTDLRGNAPENLFYTPYSRLRLMESDPALSLYGNLVDINERSVMASRKKCDLGYKVLSFHTFFAVRSRDALLAAPAGAAIYSGFRVLGDRFQTDSKHF
jgi:hypothetical protein